MDEKRRLDDEYKDFVLRMVGPSCRMAPSSSTPLLLVLSSHIVLLVLVLLAGKGQASRGEEALVEFPQVQKKKLDPKHLLDPMTNFSMKNKEFSTRQNEVSQNLLIRK